MTVRVINNSLQPQMLESGVQLGAAGTTGSSRTGVKLSAADRARLVEPGIVSVVEVEEPAPETQKPEAQKEEGPAPKRKHA